MTPHRLMELAERCENLMLCADGDSGRRALDEEIAKAVGTYKTGTYPGGDKLAGHKFFSAPFYTTSLDAATTLVPEGAIWDVSSTGCCWIMFDDVEDVIAEQISVQAATPALALCAAALKSLARKEER